MKTGRTLLQLAEEVERQKEAKKDYLVDTRNMRMWDDNSLEIRGLGLGGFPVRDTAHKQIGERLGIPARYYDRMRKDNPALLATNVNAWFNKEPETRMLRTLDGGLRAFLSNSYRPLDNAQLLEAALPVFSRIGVDVVSCEVTERRLYVKVVDKSLTIDLQKQGKTLGSGHQTFDTVSPALVLSNSEIGFGALEVSTSVWTHGCTNLMVIRERSHRKTHLGARSELTGEDTYALLSDATKEQTDKALWMQIGDVVEKAFERAQFDAIVEKLQAAAGDEITGDPVKTVEVLQKQFSLTDGERGSVLTHLIKGGDLSRYGLHAAVTRAAEDLEDYDRASEFERLGGTIIELPKTDWASLAKAA